MNHSPAAIYLCKWKRQNNLWHLLKVNRSGVFIVNFQQISLIALMFLMMNVNN